LNVGVKVRDWGNRGVACFPHRPAYLPIRICNTEWIFTRFKSSLATVATVRPRLASVDVTISTNLVAFSVDSVDYPWIGTCSLSIEKEEEVRGVRERWGGGGDDVFFKS
jgi:hypothetical protein